MPMPSTTTTTASTIGNAPTTTTAPLVVEIDVDLTALDSVLAGVAGELDQVDLNETEGDLP
jgi:hypothetical protein